jgi:HSP20 family protein
LTINVPVDADKVEATFENGVLTITLPKSEAARPKVIKVEAKK